MTSQDLVKGIDITGQEDVTGSQLNQLVDAGRPAEDKGLQIETTDTAEDTPEVPNPNVELEGITPTHWKRYLWKRAPFTGGEIKTYQWNESLTSDATFLKWELISESGEEALALAETANNAAINAQADANIAKADATNAVSLANVAVGSAGQAQTDASTALNSVNAIGNSVAALQSQVATLEETFGAIEIPLPVNKGGTGSAEIPQAQINLGLGKTPVACAILKNVQASGVFPESLLATVWNKRTLNTLAASAGEIGWITLNGDSTFTLQPGTYIIEASAPGAVVDGHIARLSRSGTTIALGTSERANSSYGGATASRIDTIISILVALSYQIDHFVETAAFGGSPAGLAGVTELYTVVKITRLAS